MVQEPWNHWIRQSFDPVIIKSQLSDVPYLIWVGYGDWIEAIFPHMLLSSMGSAALKVVYFVLYIRALESWGIPGQILAPL